MPDCDSTAEWDGYSLPIFIQNVEKNRIIVTDSTANRKRKVSEIKPKLLVILTIVVNEALRYCPSRMDQVILEQETVVSHALFLFTCAGILDTFREASGIPV